MAGPEEEADAIQLAWGRETQGSVHEGKPFPDMFNLVVHQHNSTMRSRVKNAVIYYVGEDFGLKSSKSRAENRQRSRHLIEDDRYTHEFPDDKKNRWFAWTALAVIRRAFFGDRKVDGFKHSDLFHPMPLPLIALTFTAIRCALDEWTRGKKESIPFRVSEYEDVYEGHVRNLVALEIGNGQAMVKIQEWYWKRVTGSKDRASGQRASKLLSTAQLMSTIDDAMARESSDWDGESESESLESSND
ncbi:hypothetical protein M407DRAFT_17663 [Tulasnella calospora MUT 4182]|uniref:DUF6532 domain-containing protein n=1 Tax=Tulasnella calospora MUT 4182 TaxID=1051891 RepID=A0A0C3LHG3_9AGAM|nr:hypothetical protein M407DRAFT_17663 [Tulasnella calospora MUT 4182]